MTKRHPGPRRRELLRRSLLYFIVDPTSPPGPSGLERVKRATGPGRAGLVQVRWKGARPEAVAAYVEELRPMVGPDVLILVNDDPQAAVSAGADGVHVGQGDLTPSAAREIVGPDRLIGLSTHSLVQFRSGLQTDADYLAIGSMFPTGTKSNAEVIGLAGLPEIARAAGDRVWFAIGGIDLERIEALLRGGCRRAAISSAVARADDPGDAAKRLYAALAAGPSG